MPKTKKKALAYRRVAEGLYGDMFGATKRSKLVAASEEWEDEELFIVAHLTYLKLQQGERILSLLEDITGNTADMADAMAEEDSDEDSDDDDALEDDPEEVDGQGVREVEPDEHGEVILPEEVPASLASGAPFDHPVPPEASS